MAETYGGEVSRWPAEAQANAEAVLIGEPELVEAILKDAKALDALLDLVPIEPASSALSEQIVSSIEGRIKPIPDWAAMAAAVALVVGMGTGWMSSAPTETGVSDDEALYASAFDALFESEDSTALEEA
jgi:hypothetical protein